ncbi:MAG: hypothetical protein EP330_25520 [Deltaproteobacteria bacterium]|nr:MAG: hypothetical protein EP330_25520 [Deltaproteobacteria bacterium]
MNQSLESLLDEALGGRTTQLWEAFVAERKLTDVDAFVVWLRDQRQVDADTARKLLLVTRLEVFSDSQTEATFSDAGPFDSGFAITNPILAPEGSGHTRLANLGSGAMGEVYLVRDESLRRKVALKRITRRAAGNRILASRFLTEAQITAQLEHPNIIPVHAFERDEQGHPAYTMKLIQGQTLKQFLRVCREYYERGEEPEEDYALPARLEAFLKVCDAMAYAHDRGVLHRDLKPDNIMLGPFGEVVVMDWGIARIMGSPEQKIETLTGLETLSDKTHLTRLGQALGTPAYMSPEQALGENNRLDGRSDLVALGLILYELLTLERAYQAQTPVTLLTQAQEADVPPVHAKLAGLRVPRELAAIVRKATARRPNDRYESVDAFADDIRRYLRGDEVIASPDSGIQKFARFVGRHRQLTLFALVGMALFSGLVALGGAVRVQAEQAAAQRREAQLLDLLGTVGGHAHRVDAQLTRYTALLEGLGASARASLTMPVSEPVPVFRNADFAVAETAPADAFESDRYWQRVSFGHPVLKLAPEVDAEGVQTRMQQLARVQPAFRELFLRSHDEASARQSPTESEALLRSQRVPVVWSYVAVEDGIHTSYPGHGGYPEAYDPRARPWYRAAVELDGPHWGAPYVDINGLGLILPCNLALRDHDGKLLGVAGLELTFGRVIRDLVRPDEVVGAVEAYLVDREGKIIVSSEDEGDDAERGTDLSEAAELTPFPVANVVALSAEQSSGTWVEGDELYAWTRLVTIDWTYVVRGPAQPMIEGRRGAQGE